MDSRTEGVILDALDRLREGRTTLIIAHRLSTIRHADLIVVLDGERVVEMGTHADLVEARGLYRQLHDSQEGRRAAVHSAPGATPPTADPHGSGSPRGGASPTSKPKVVVLGMMSKMPVAGVIWQTVHYLVGLRRLGLEPFYVEAHARTPSIFMSAAASDGSAAAADFIGRVMQRFDFGDRWAYQALHADSRVYGLSDERLRHLYREADLILNLHGGTKPLPEHAASGRLVYLETDPVQLQVELARGDQSTVDFLEPHSAFFTFAENIGRADCSLPVDPRFAFRTTRQPVVIDFWRPHGLGDGDAFTTIGSWKQPWRDVNYEGRTYSWSKHLEFAKFLDVPERSGRRVELALANLPEEDRKQLLSHGWGVRDALGLSSDLDEYRRFVATSRGEFTVAKDQNVRMRTGWFSDRSATYLASGRPVVTQDTGFGTVLPTGRGLFAFSTGEEAVAALDEIESDYATHRKAAAEIAEESFAAARVLSQLLGDVGVPIPAPEGSTTTADRHPPWWRRGSPRCQTTWC